MSAPPPPGRSLNRRHLMGLAALAVLAASWGIGRRRSAAPAVTEKLSIALPQAPHAGLIHIAAARGFFEERGLAVTVLAQTHGKAALAELLRGGADLAAAADVPIVIEVLKGAPLSIAAAVASASNELAVLARRDREIASPGELQGRRVGVTLGTSGEYFLWAFMVRHRLAPQSLVLVDLSPTRLVEALRSGSVDAIAAWQPVRHEAELALGDAIVSFRAPDAYAQNYVLVGRSEFLSARGEALRRLLLALLDAERFVQTDPLQAKTLLAERLKLSTEALEPAWQALELEVDEQQAQLVTLEDVAGWAMARGYAPTQPMPNFLAHLNFTALQAASPGRVTVVR
ncbi:NitT/TauT family transport system substrate-binding protein [Pelomonas saccharophila]|uniref:NitT/TauT family transport system substrate-binding protein n=1 Tax=Roseateles saccharophilus TaxID=304 RepID=A0ABU1YUQ9_ROSSA|nr:ABC transporter substrate-binding protein [Roseateles saccharophilus]MDR7272598.1 NitT/TauT family transport system substrate-binding protein [Roseateles saccharophilus]